MATASASRLDWRRRAPPRPPVLVAVGVAGIVATALTAWAVANSPILVHPRSDAIWRSLFVAEYVAVVRTSGGGAPRAGWARSSPALGSSSDGVAERIRRAARVHARHGVAAGRLRHVHVPVRPIHADGSSRSSTTVHAAFALSTAVVWGLILAVSPTLPGGSDFTTAARIALQRATDRQRARPARRRAAHRLQHRLDARNDRRRDAGLLQGTIADASTPARIDPAGRRRARHRRRVCRLAVRSFRVPGDDGSADDHQRGPRGGSSARDPPRPGSR